jgi:2''-5'' RNA ligase
MRLFIGINLPFFVKQSLFRTQLRLKKLGVKGSWKLPKYFHITLEFLGESPPESVPVISQILRIAISHKKILKLNIDKLGAFPSFNRPHTIWAGVGGDVDKLDEIWSKIYAELGKNGFNLQKASFKPHIALLSRPKSIELDLTSFKPERTGNFTIYEITLFESKTENGKRTYPILYQARLKR